MALATYRLTTRTRLIFLCHSLQLLTSIRNRAIVSRTIQARSYISWQQYRAEPSARLLLLLLLLPAFHRVVRLISLPVLRLVVLWEKGVPSSRKLLKTRKAVCEH